MGTHAADGAQAQLSGFDLLYGLELLELTDQGARAQVPVSERLLQPAGLVHGGVYATIAESITTLATSAASGSASHGQTNSTSFMRPITHGTIHASAAAVHRGRTTWVWEVRFTDDEGRLCSITRMTVAVRRDAVPAAHA